VDEKFGMNEQVENEIGVERMQEGDMKKPSVTIYN